MRTDAPASNDSTVKEPTECVNDLDQLASGALRAIFDSRLPVDDRYKHLGLKERAAKLQEEFHEEGCGEGDEAAFTFRYMDQPALYAARFHINEALRKLSGKQSPRVSPGADRRKTWLSQREKLLIRYFEIVQSRDQTGALVHPKLHDKDGNIKMTLDTVNEVLFGSCAKRLSKARFTRAWKSLWRNGVAKVLRWTGFRGNIRWVQFDWERWNALLVASPKEQHEADSIPAPSFRRDLSPREVNRALSLLHSRSLRGEEEMEQVARVKRLRISDPFANRWFDVQCWEHNRPNPYFFKQPADHEVRSQAFEPLIKTCCRIFAPTRKGTFRGPTYTNRTRALVKLVSAKELCSKAGITARQLRYEMEFINEKPLGVLIERVGRDLLAVSLQPEDLYFVREHIDTWKRQMPSEWVEPKMVNHSTDQEGSGAEMELDFGQKSAVFDVNRADNAGASSSLLEIAVAFTSSSSRDVPSFSIDQIASFPSCPPFGRLEQLKPVPGSSCYHFKKKGANTEVALEGVRAASLCDVAPAITQSPAERSQLPTGKVQPDANPVHPSDEKLLARIFGDDDGVREDDPQTQDDFWNKPWSGWLPRECKEMVEVLQERLRVTEQFTNKMALNLRKLSKLPDRWRLTPERLHNFLDIIDDPDSSAPFWLRVVPVEQLLTLSTWKFALRATLHELLLRICLTEKLNCLREFAFGDLDKFSPRDIASYLTSGYFSAEEFQLLGRDPRALLHRLRMQAVEEFYCDPATFDYDDLKGEGPEFAAQLEEIKAQATYNFLERLCRVPSWFLQKTDISDACLHEKPSPPINTPTCPEPTRTAVCAPAKPSSEEPVALPVQKSPSMSKTVLPSPPPLPEKWRYPETPLFPFPILPVPEERVAVTVVPHANGDAPCRKTPLVPEGIMPVLTTLHSHFSFNNTPEILEAIRSLASLAAPWDLSEQRVWRYFALWDGGKLAETCKTRKIARFLHPHFWRRVANYVNYYPG